jgi:rSAM/selenodomain-associated transferase 2
VVPVLNEADRVACFLDDLQGFRHQGAELVLVDGGSTDGTLVILQEMRAAALVDKLLVSSSGRSRQMNIGAASASSDLLLFLHADTVLPDDTLLLLAPYRAKSLVWGCFDVKLSGSKRPFRVIEWFMNKRSKLTGIATGDQALFVSRTLFEKVGGFAMLPIMEDIELCRRLKRLVSPDRVPVAVLTSSRRWEKNGIYRTVALMWYLRLAYFMGVPASRLWQRYWHGR